MSGESSSINNAPGLGVKRHRRKTSRRRGTNDSYLQQTSVTASGYRIDSRRSTVEVTAPPDSPRSDDMRAGCLGCLSTPVSARGRLSTAVTNDWIVQASETSLLTSSASVGSAYLTDQPLLAQDSGTGFAPSTVYEDHFAASRNVSTMRSRSAGGGPRRPRNACCGCNEVARSKQFEIDPAFLHLVDNETEGTSVDDYALSTVMEEEDGVAPPPTFPPAAHELESIQISAESSSLPGTLVSSAFSSQLHQQPRGETTESGLLISRNETTESAMGPGIPSLGVSFPSMTRENPFHDDASQRLRLQNQEAAISAAQEQARISLQVQQEQRVQAAERHSRAMMEQRRVEKQRIRAAEEHRRLAEEQQRVIEEQQKHAEVQVEQQRLVEQQRWAEHHQKMTEQQRLTEQQILDARVAANSTVLEVAQDSGAALQQHPDVLRFQLMQEEAQRTLLQAQEKAQEQIRQSQLRVQKHIQHLQENPHPVGEDVTPRHPHTTAETTAQPPQPFAHQAKPIVRHFTSPSTQQVQVAVPTPAPMTIAPAPMTIAPAPRTMAPAPMTIVPAPMTIAPMTIAPAPITIAPAPLTKARAPTPMRIAPMTVPVNVAPVAVSVTPGPSIHLPAPAEDTTGLVSMTSASEYVPTTTEAPVPAPTPHEVMAAISEVTPVMATTTVIRPTNMEPEIVTAAGEVHQSYVHQGLKLVQDLHRPVRVTTPMQIVETTTPMQMTNPAMPFVMAPGITIAPPPTTHIVPPPAITMAPSTATTMAPATFTTMAPATFTTMAPATFTTMAPATVPTMAPATVPTMAPASVTTMAPATVTTMAPATFTTMAPATVPTMAPATVTTMAPATVTTMAPATVTTIAPSTIPQHASIPSGTFVPHPLHVQTVPVTSTPPPISQLPPMSTPMSIPMTYAPPMAIEIYSPPVTLTPPIRTVVPVGDSGDESSSDSEGQSPLLGSHLPAPTIITGPVSPRTHTTMVLQHEASIPGAAYIAQQPHLTAFGVSPSHIQSRNVYPAINQLQIEREVSHVMEIPSAFQQMHHQPMTLVMEPSIYHLPPMQHLPTSVSSTTMQPSPLHGGSKYRSRSQPLSPPETYVSSIRHQSPATTIIPARTTGSTTRFESGSRLRSWSQPVRGQMYPMVDTSERIISAFPGERKLIATQTVSNNIVAEEFMGGSLADRFGAENIGRDEHGEYVIKKIEVHQIEERVTQIMKKEVVENVIERKVPQVEIVERVVEVPQIQVVEKHVDVPTYQEVLIHKPVKQVVDRPVEVLKTVTVPQFVPRIETKEVPGEIVEIPKTFIVERPVLVPKYVDRKVPVVIAQSFWPQVVEAEETDARCVVDVECRIINFVTVASDVFVPLPVQRPMVFDHMELRHREVFQHLVPDEQYNALVKALNPSLALTNATDLFRFVPISKAAERRGEYCDLNDLGLGGLPLTSGPGTHIIAPRDDANINAALPGCGTTIVAPQQATTPPVHITAAELKMPANWKVVPPANESLAPSPFAGSTRRAESSSVALPADAATPVVHSVTASPLAPPRTQPISPPTLFAHFRDLSSASEAASNMKTYDMILQNSQVMNRQLLPTSIHQRALPNELILQQHMRSGSSGLSSEDFSTQTIETVLKAAARRGRPTEARVPTTRDDGEEDTNSSHSSQMEETQSAVVLPAKSGAQTRLDNLVSWARELEKETRDEKKKSSSSRKKKSKSSSSSFEPTQSATIDGPIWKVAKKKSASETRAFAAKRV